MGSTFPTHGSIGTIGLPFSALMPLMPLRPTPPTSCGPPGRKHRDTMSIVLNTYHNINI